MKTKNYLKKKMYDTLAFVFFLIGSTIIYWKLGRWVAIGVALEVLPIYMLSSMRIWKSIDKTKDNEDEETDTND